jgi:hypothetical protein
VEVGTFGMVVEVMDCFSLTGIGGGVGMGKDKETLMGRC